MNTDLQKWIDGLMVPEKPDESEVKALLARFGIAAPKGIRILPGASDFPAETLSPPCVAKVCAGEILHKTDLGGVMLNLDRESLPGAIRALQERFPGTPVLAEEQAAFEGPEFIVGALVDPGFGPAVMAGAGGVLTELYGDVSFRLAPCTRKEARAMLDELTLAPVFRGFRGSDLTPDGLADIIVKAGELALAFGPRFSQLDLNPVVWSDGRWMALDAKLILSPGMQSACGTVTSPALL
ncbi:acetyl-CoA synthetase [Desulfonema ishimotonii]|uniref:Acetyl-CoA synthetase n=1 Tax=Desulfonema ishimotonii TaxID=45657 RepID=A0A401G1B7_9BACT|nr:acetate--CoA ligase family protein [Desulfonema ishimotonii]GBC63010.1 acetyl-CoA synthetase [Desulfonema ishimotonii]